jgi:hypothetical protein
MVFSEKGAIRGEIVAGAFAKGKDRLKPHFFVRQARAVKGA